MSNTNKKRKKRDSTNRLQFLRIAASLVSLNSPKVGAYLGCTLIDTICEIEKVNENSATTSNEQQQTRESYLMYERLEGNICKRCGCEFAAVRIARKKAKGFNAEKVPMNSKATPRLCKTQKHQHDGTTGKNSPFRCGLCGSNLPGYISRKEAKRKEHLRRRELVVEKLSKRRQLKKKLKRKDKRNEKKCNKHNTSSPSNKDEMHNNNKRNSLDQTTTAPTAPTTFSMMNEDVAKKEGLKRTISKVASNKAKKKKKKQKLAAILQTSRGGSATSKGKGKSNKSLGLSSFLSHISKF
eukprot:m.54978 g.54978  ORF g.54978 m.54978 type:complete len:296 (+) comp11103_c0_seq1:144-1031(+)